MLRDLVEELAHKVRRALENLHAFLEALGLLLPARSDNTIPLDWVRALRRRHLDVERAAQRLLDEIHGLAGGAQRLEMAEGLGDPVLDLPVLAQGGDVGAAGDEGCVEHGRALAVVVVVWDDALGGRLVLAVGVDGGALGADDEGQGAGGLDGGLHTGEGDGVVAVADDDGDAAAGDGGGLGKELGLGEVRGAAAVVLLEGLGWDRGADHLGDFLGELEVDFGEAMAGEPFVDRGVVAVVKLEAEGLLHVELLVLRHGVVKELSLVVVLAEFVAEGAVLDALHALGVGCEPATLGAGWGNGFEAVGPVVNRALRDSVAHLSVSVVVEHRAHWTVDWQLFPIDAQAADLGVEVGEVSALEKWIVGEVDARDDVAGAECDLLGLGEEFVDVAVQLELSNNTKGHKVFRPDLGRIQDVEFKVILLLLWNDLDCKVPLRVRLVVDGLHEVFAMEIRVLASQLQGFVPDKRVHTQMGDPVELDKVSLSLFVDESKSVHTKSLHHSVGSGDGAVRHGPHEHVGGLRVQVHKVPKVVVSCLGLRNLVVWLWLDSMNWQQSQI